MSKLFPMFKKKGKGKEDDVNDEELPKRKGKTERVKEVLLSPVGSSLSPSKMGKHRKKGKGAKEKRALNGKVNNSSSSNGAIENLHSPEEAEVHLVEDFYVDDDGTVKVGPHEEEEEEEDRSFVDEVMSSVEESFSMEHERSRSFFSSSELPDNEGIILGGDGEKVDGCNMSLSTSRNIDRLDAEPQYDQYCDRISQGSRESEKDTSMINLESSHNDDNSDESGSKNSEKQSVLEHTVAESVITEGLGESQIEHGMTEKELLTDSLKVEELKTNDDEPKVKIEVSENLNDVANPHDQVNDSLEIKDDDAEVFSITEELTPSSSSRLGVESRVSGGGDTEFLSVAEDLPEESVTEKSERLVTDPFTSSQDSDDDFDSAQEDWDEDEDNGPQNRSLEDTHKSMESEAVNPSLLSQLPVCEARNYSLVSNEGEESKGARNRVSSIYEDAKIVLEESGLLEESSDDKLPLVSEESRKVRKISGSERLVRKLSNISMASSDAFNEELDDLLDEELDRLSEEEEAGGIETKSTESQNNTGSCISEARGATSAFDLPVKSAVDGGALPPPVENDKKKLEHDDDKVENGEVDSAHSSPIVDSSAAQTPSDDSSIKHQSSVPKEGSSSSGHLAAPDESTDQVKDSGYYSLPVSPNPGAVVRASGDVDRSTKGVNDSFGDSEEEGMITPPSEASTLEDKTENPKERVSLIEDEVDNAVVVSDSNIANEAKLNEAASQIKNKVKTTVMPDVGKGQESQTDSCGPKQGTDLKSEPNLSSPKQGTNLKVIIPSSDKKKREEGIMSPKCGSPTKMRHKSPLKEMDEAFSPDPVGDRFLHQAVLLTHEEAEARLAQRRAARAEARELRLRELEKQQQDQENEEEKQFTTPSFAEPSPRATVASRTSVGRTALNSTGQYSRRSSEDSTTDESALPGNVREMRAELKELDEKFRKAMITNAQLDNEKSTLTYEVELIKDKYTELEETHTQLNKEHRRKCTEYEQLRKVSTKLQEEVKILRGMLQERDQLIQEYGLIVVGEEEENGEVPPEPDEFDDMDDLTPRKIAIKKVLLSQEAAELLEKGAAKGSLDVRLKKFGEEKNDLEDQVRRLKLELEEERNKNRRRENGLDYEKAKEQSKTVNEYKFRVQKAEAEVLTLQATVARLDALSTRYKTQSEELEKSEEELKVERRKLQRELRDAQSRLEELETTNNHLIRRFDKLKNARSNLLKDLSQDPA